MINTILVPLDGSPLAERALPHAEAIATATEARITLIRAVQAQVLLNWTPCLAGDGNGGGRGIPYRDRRVADCPWFHRRYRASPLAVPPRRSWPRQSGVRPI